MSPFRLGRRRDERGVVAILVGVLAIVLLIFAAYAVDIGLQINRKHQLNDTLDAAAQAGAYELPGSANAARDAALDFAKAHDPTETGTLAPNVDFWCVVASKGSGGVYAVDTTQIPSTCNPGTAPYTVGANYKATGQKIVCSQIICAIPCVEPTPNTATPKITCNTIRVYQGRDVPFAFGPAGGISKGSTGNIISVACKGSCGTVAPNPMDVVMIADRTLSMSQQDVKDVISGIKGMLGQMTASQQYVALGAIGRSGASTTSQSGSCTTNQLTWPSGSGTSGKWVPISFTDNYADSERKLNTSSALLKGTDCLLKQSDSDQGTNLAAPMKSAARYLLGLDANNLSSLPTRDDPPTKVIIFLTDGQPNETLSTRGTTALTDPADVFSNKSDYDTSPQVVSGPDEGSTSGSYSTRTTGSGNNRETWYDIYYDTPYVTTKTTTRTLNGGQTACQNFLNVAANAKAQKILVITIAYNLDGNVTCGGSNPSPGTSSSTDDETPVITDITPSGARTTRNGKLALNTSFKGNARIYRSFDRTITRVQTVDAPDTVVRNTLAAAASPVDGVPSASNNSCAPGAEQTAENSDGDYFFCAASGTDMASIFTTALGQVSKGIKLIRMP